MIAYASPAPDLPEPDPGPGPSPWRWTPPRWAVADILDRSPDGLAYRDLMVRLRGRGAHRWAAVTALRAVGLVVTEGRSPRTCHLRLTPAGVAAVEAERVRRRGVDPSARPLLPPRDAVGRVIPTLRDPPLATLAPGELWRRTLDLMRVFREERAQVGAAMTAVAPACAPAAASVPASAPALAPGPSPRSRGCR